MNYTSFSSNTIFVCVVPSQIDVPRAPLPRMLDYCKALNLSEQNVEGMILGYLPWLSEKTIPTEGVYHDINYFYTCLKPKRPRCKLVRGYYKICSSLCALAFLFKNKETICAVHIHFRENLWRTLWFWLCCRLTNLKLSRELAEFPFDRNVENNLREKLYRFLYESFSYKLFDGFIPITTYLEDWIGNETAYKAISVRIPISIDLQEFVGQPLPIKKKPRKLGYVGVLKYGDELELMLRMLAIVHNKIAEAELVIIGDFMGTEFDVSKKHLEFNRKQDQHKISNSITILGFIDHEQVPELLGQCDILILPRPFTLTSKAGFPSKLAEYLALEKPVVVTATGDIPLYLNDGISAYLVYSDSPDEFADKVLQAMENPDEAKRIAQKGRKVAEESFSLPVIGKSLCKYIDKLNEK